MSARTDPPARRRGRPTRRVVMLASLTGANAAWAAGDAAVSLAGRPVAQALVLLGSIFLLAAAVGVLRFPDFYVRLHAATKLVTLGGLGIFGGAAIVFAEAQASERVLLIAAFFFLTAPLSGYMIARAGYLRGIPPVREDGSVDEWGACGAAGEELDAGEIAAGEPARQLPSARDGSAADG